MTLTSGFSLSIKEIVKPHTSVSGVITERGEILCLKEIETLKRVVRRRPTASKKALGPRDNKYRLPYVSKPLTRLKSAVAALQISFSL